MLELLESRIAPAVLLNPKTVQYTDPQGDIVLVHTTVGSWDLAHDLVFGSVGGSAGEILLRMDLADKPKFIGAKISVNATAHAGGDGLANVGFIDATNITLASVFIDGDLGHIHAGNAFGNPVALGTLQVASMGSTGLASQGGSGNLGSFFSGAVGSVKVLHDLTGASISASSVGRLEIGGSLVGTSDGFSGSIYAGQIGSLIIKGDLKGSSGGFSGSIRVGSLGSVLIGGDLKGGSSQDTGAIVASGHLGKVTIQKNVYGDDGQGSGTVRSGTAGTDSVTIGLALFGGKGPASGQIQSNGNIGVVQIGTKANSSPYGSVYGYDGTGGGSVYASGKIGQVVIHGDLFGGGALGTGVISGYNGLGKITVLGNVYGGHGFESGQIISAAGRLSKVVVTGSVYGGNAADKESGGESGYISGGVIGSVFIGKDLVAGSKAGSGTLFNSGAIISDHSIGSIEIRGNITGNAAVPVLISARGAAQQTTQQDIAIGSIKVGGSITGANILAGFDRDRTPTDVDAQIGSIGVGKDVHASNFVAGVTTGSGDSYWGDNNDQRIGDTTDLSFPSRIASIIIGGVLEGSTASTTDHFGFVADQIGFLSIHGTKVTLSPGPMNDSTPKLIAGSTGDVFLREV